MKTNKKYNNITIDIGEIGNDYSEVSTYTEELENNNENDENNKYFNNMNILGEREMDMLPPVIDYNKKFNYYRNLSIKEHIRGPSNDNKVIQAKVKEEFDDVKKDRKLRYCWISFSKTVTCCICPICLTKCGKTSKLVQLAWREKVAMVLIYLFMMAVTGYFTFGLQKTLCNSKITGYHPWRIINKNRTYTINKINGPIIRGYAYTYDQLKQLGIEIPERFNNTNINSVFLSKKNGNFRSKCNNISSHDNYFCRISDVEYFPCQDVKILDSVVSTGKQVYTWDDIEAFRNPSLYLKERPSSQEDYDIFVNSKLFVFNGGVFNVTNLINDSNESTIISSEMKETLKSLIGRDATLYFSRHYKYSNNQDLSCILEQYIVGYVDKKSIGCFISQVYIYMTLILILGIVLVRFFMAIVFRYFLAPRLFKKKNYSKNTMNGPRTSLNTIRAIAYHSKDAMKSTSNDTLSCLSRYMSQTESDLIDTNIKEHESIKEDENMELYTICLVTCYSEGEVGIRSTLDSIACTEYDDSKKLLFIIADGLIKGEGNNQLTSDIILGLISERYNQYKNPASRMPEPKLYVSIALGNKQRNMARVHAGIYTSLDKKHQVPIIVVVKCGNPEEANDSKPGNRGKRDSQVILMNFLNRILFNDRMTPLDYELTYQIQHTTGVFPDEYDLVLMVDADTKVKPDSLTYMVKAMVCDEKIMGLCGETRILNKTSSFVTAIQVFEYYISHHLSKAFESVFGGVTCLPGCFCMYRVKSRKYKSNYVVPILANPDIISEYSQNVVDSLHKKNLLLLGEDRFLSTLMLKTFPKRKMMFIPQARCKTIVPDTFKVLLSQRRRWINSTIHNLLKLVFVNDLCGIFCFSMQFVVFFELCGTVVLPAALSFTIYICLSFIFSHSVEVLPLILLFAILGLPGVLIFLTSMKWNYIIWMIIYLFALPIWNFILPLYAVWHMDDFSWGETRKISSNGKESKNISNDVDITSVENKSLRVPFKHWSEYEFERVFDCKPPSPYIKESSARTVSVGSVLGSPLIRKNSVSSFNSVNSSIYSNLISNYNHNGGSSGRLNYHEILNSRRNSEIDKLEGNFGKSDITEIRKSSFSKSANLIDRNSKYLNNYGITNNDFSSIVRNSYDNKSLNELNKRNSDYIFNDTMSYNQGDFTNIPTISGKHLSDYSIVNNGNDDMKFNPISYDPNYVSYGSPLKTMDIINSNDQNSINQNYSYPDMNDNGDHSKIDKDRSFDMNNNIRNNENFVQDKVNSRNYLKNSNNNEINNKKIDVTTATKNRRKHSKVNVNDNDLNNSKDFVDNHPKNNRYNNNTINYEEEINKSLSEITNILNNINNNDKISKSSGKSHKKEHKHKHSSSHHCNNNENLNTIENNENQYIDINDDIDNNDYILPDDIYNSIVVTRSGNLNRKKSLNNVDNTSTKKKHHKKRSKKSMTSSSRNSSVHNHSLNTNINTNTNTNNNSIINNENTNIGNNYINNNGNNNNNN